MKRTPILLLSALLSVVSAAPRLFAEDAPTRSSSDSIEALYPFGYRASDVLGRNIVDGRGLNLGRIGDLVINSRTGAIMFAVVSTGGVLGIGDTTRAVPISSFELTGSPRNEFRIDIDSGKWAAAPRFVAEEVSFLENDDRVAELYQYYGQMWTRQNEAVDAAGRQVRRSVTLATWMKGKAVGEGQRGVGKIDDVVVSRDLTRAALLLDPVDEYTEDSEKYVVPFSRFSLGDSDPEALSSNISPDELRSAGVLNDEGWAKPESAIVYRWGNRVAPESRNVAEQTRSQRTDRQAPSAGLDVAPPLESVRRAIQGDTELRDSVHSVDVIAQSNRLVLRGTVPTESVKDKVLDRAEAAAYGWRIDDQLRVERR